jgi:hypothetical protein
MKARDISQELFIATTTLGGSWRHIDLDRGSHASQTTVRTKNFEIVIRASHFTWVIGLPGLGVADVGFAEHISPIRLAMGSDHVDDNILAVGPVWKCEYCRIPKGPRLFFCASYRTHGDVVKQIWKSYVASELVGRTGTMGEVDQLLWSFDIQGFDWVDEFCVQKFLGVRVLLCGYW